MKYLREVTPYFKRTSALNDIGWNQSREGTLSRDGTGTTGSAKNWSDRKMIPLKYSYLCRNLRMPDAQMRIIEVHSADGKGSCILRCSDDRTASQWFNAIHSNIQLLVQQAIGEANQMLRLATNSSGEIKHMSWLAEQVFKYCFSISQEFLFFVCIVILICFVSHLCVINL